MRLLRWAKIVGTGTAMLGVGVVLGACGGYSNLGDLPGNGGEGDGSGGMSTGAEGGSSGKGTGATGGTGMGATGNVGTGATGGTGRGATGNVGMGATGNVGMGATGNVGMGATGNVGMGGTGVGGGCMVPDDCPQPPPVCGMCDDGSSPCAHATCEGGVCGIVMPTCAERCAPDAPCGASCGADGSSVCNAEGSCIQGPVMCPGQFECTTSNDCVTIDVCAPCGDGCARASCVDGACAMVCPIGGKCSIDMDCGSELPDNICTIGLWMCLEGACSRLHRDCTPPEDGS